MPLPRVPYYAGIVEKEASRMALPIITIVLTKLAVDKRRIEGDKNLKKIIILTLSVMLLLVGTTLWAQVEGHGRTADVIINEIKQNQSVESIIQIDPNQVTPALLEELGDAVMGLMIGDEQQHEWMDEMMGGEDSPQLASNHRWIAYNYLQNDGELNTWGPGMMGFGIGGHGMMGNWNFNRIGNGWGYGPGNMMGWSGSWWGWIITLVVIIVIAAIVIAIYLSRKKGTSNPQEALEILRTRYAEGKITREEYQQMLKELKE